MKLIEIWLKDEEYIKENFSKYIKEKERKNDERKS